MRTRRRAILSLFVLLFLYSGKQRAVTHPTSLDVPLRDVFSFANPREVRVEHLSLDLSVDFAAHTLSGTATLEIENLTGAPAIVLDTYR
ncbi:MAG TPA: hypothetical protein VHL59_15140, partial [Thermoanaerobaculia bacterium]|nr:hypothetical protein [Thermoanaerobaculia bacterium]